LPSAAARRLYCVGAAIKVENRRCGIGDRHAKAKVGQHLTAAHR
jgi:hypothetical protein